jgi:pyruvate ferredoxin oxidoreductase gamma subunit
MLASIVKVAEIMDQDVFLEQMEASYKHKFAKKPEVIEGNMNALRMAFAEVK